MTHGRWERFCLIGIGGHARNCLIPALAANGQVLAGLVSTKAARELPDAPVFRMVEEAVAMLPADTAFVIASPPSAHAAQAAVVLNAGRDLIVEKPAFVTVSEARAAIDACAASGAILVEGFMNRHTATHRRFLADCVASPPVAIDCTFTIPEAPGGTFRTDTAIGSSNLYDIASYFLAALVDVGLLLDGVELTAVDCAGHADRERLHFSGNAGRARISATIGIDQNYANRLALVRADGVAISYAPFFFGRSAPRAITITREGESSDEVLDDHNAFEAMFAVPPATWRDDQSERHARMATLAATLERLGGDLSRLRAAAR